MPIQTPSDTFYCLVCNQGKRRAVGRLYHQVGATGVAILGTGGDGAALYENDPQRKSIADGVYDAGYDVVTLEWEGEGEFGGILTNMRGDGYYRSYGFGWTTALGYIRRRLDLEAPARIVAAGNSGGGLQFLYSMQRWRTDRFFAGVVPSGGPPTYKPGFGDCIGSTRTDYLMDWAEGTCLASSPPWTPEQEAAYRLELLEAGRLDFDCPVHIVNSVDNSSDTNSGEAFADDINLAGGSAVHETVAGSSHNVDQTVAGSAAILAALLDFLGAT